MSHSAAPQSGSSQRGAPAIVPEGFGTAIPSNPAELMKFLQQQRQMQKAAASSTDVKKAAIQQSSTGGHHHTLSEERLKKQEHDREDYESRLMQMEDFIFTSEGASRIKRIEDRLKMETEDALSIQLKIIFKEHDKERLREQIKREVEARKAAEIAEREARKVAAEERRKAVVERIRRQQELEEQRKRDAEMARLRILEEQARKEQEEKDRLLADQTGMTMEDQLSALAEQDFREYLERKAWQQRERERLLEWEKEQKRKDALEEEQRKLRMAELEEKKKKLEALRQQQQAQNAQSAAAAQAMKEEGERINKQLRIQNRAKFVSKKMSNATPAAAPVVPMVSEPPVSVVAKPLTPREIMVPAAVPPSAVSIMPDIASPSPAKLNKQMSRIMSMKNLDEVIFNNAPATSTTANTIHSVESKPTVATSTVPVTQRILSVDPVEIDRFKSKLQDITSDAKLKEMQKDLMQQKRILRLEQRQKSSMVNENDSNREMSDEEFKLQQKLLEIDMKHDAVEKRLNQLVCHVSDSSVIEQSTNDATEVPRGSFLADIKRPPSASSKAANTNTVMTRGKSFKDSLHNRSQRIQLPINPVEESASPMTSPPLQTESVPDYSEIFKKIEVFLRNCNKLLFSIDFENGNISHDQSKKSLTSSSSSQLLNSVNPSRQLTMYILEISQLLKEVNKDYDPLGYIEKLHEMSKKLKEKLEELERKQKDIEASNKKSNKVRLSPRIEASEKSPINLLTPRKDSNTLSRPSSASRQKDAAQQQTLMSSISTPAIPSQLSPVGSRVSSFHESSLLPDKSLSPTPKVDTIIDSEFGAITIVDDKPTDCENVSTEDNEEEIPNPETIPGWEDCIYTSMFSAAHHAAYFGFTDVLKFLIKFFDCFIMDKKGRTPLFYAALANRLDCVAILLELGPDWIDVGDEKGDTPLHAAAISNSVQVLAFLLSCEAHPDTANNLGKTPSHLARSEETLQLLSDSGATLYCVDNSNHMPLWYACAENRIECVKYLCQRTPKEFILWQDDEGDSCLHKAASSGQGNVVEILCQHVAKIEDLCLANKRQYTPAHVAANASVLKALYENGANLWILDGKQHMPLFLASFHGKTDCVAFLLDIGTKLSSVSLPSISMSKSRPTSASGSNSPNRGTNPSGMNIHEGVFKKDKQGDTALHVAAVCGHIACVSLLLYYIRNEKNNQQLTPAQLAKRAGHSHISQLIEYYEGYRLSDPQLTSQEIFQTDFSTLASIILYYGSRWSLAYDSQFATVYYLDYCTGASQWNKPEAFDVTPKEEGKYMKALEILLGFYEKYNPEKVKDAHNILTAFHGRYTELFINLANRYNVQDLSMFQGVDFDS